MYLPVPGFEPRPLCSSASVLPTRPQWYVGTELLKKMQNTNFLYGLHLILQAIPVILTLEFLMSLCL